MQGHWTVRGALAKPHRTVSHMLREKLNLLSLPPSNQWLRATSGRDSPSKPEPAVLSRLSPSFLVERARGY